MDNVFAALRLIVLLVLTVPLASAVLVGLLGRHSSHLARRTAAILAAVHLGLTGMLAYGVNQTFIDRGANRGGEVFRHYFSPSFVPGDPGQPIPASSVLDDLNRELEQGPAGEIGETTWSLLSFGPGMRGLPAPDVQLFLGIDGLNIWLLVLTSLMTLVAIWVSWDSITERAAGYYAWLFVLETGVIGAFLSFDVILFYVFFELTLIPAFFLIGYWGVGSARRAAAGKFFLYTLFGSLFTLTGIVGIVLTNPTPYASFGPSAENPQRKQIIIAHAPIQPENRDAMPTHRGPITFSLPWLMRNVYAWSEHYPREAQYAVEAADAADARWKTARTKAAASPNDAAAKRTLEDALARKDLADRAKTEAESARDSHRKLQAWLFFALMAGFAVKIPIVPFHTWLPGAYSEAPIAVTMLLSALLAKLGTFGILRIVLPLCPDAAFAYGLPVFGFLGAAGIVYAALCAFAQRDLKLLVAYSSVSHLGLLVLGLFSINREGVAGATLHMVNHGLSTGMMFALLGFLSSRYRTLDMNQYGGLIGKFPAFAAFFFVAALASVGLPGLNNFVSEMLILAGLFDRVHTSSIGYGLAIAGAAGIFLSAWYTMTMLRNVFFGPTHTPPTAEGEVRDVTGREWLAFGVPGVLCLVLGLYPQPVLDVIQPDANVVVHCSSLARIRAGYPPVQRPARPLVNVPRKSE